MRDSGQRLATGVPILMLDLICSHPVYLSCVTVKASSENPAQVQSNHLGQSLEDQEDHRRTAEKMWRRFGMGQQQQPPLIGNPTLIETTVDDGYLETIQEVESIISRESSVRHPSQLPELPFRSIPPLHQQGTYDRASSVYSQPSPPRKSEERKVNIRGEQDDLHRSGTIKSDVSSLTIRSSVDNDSRSSPMVSPISTHFPEHLQNTKQEHPFRSQLPRLVQPETKDAQIGRMAPSCGKPSSPLTAEQKQETRWDDYSGEPTASDARRPASARPDITPVEVHYPQLKERTKQILAVLRERDTAKRGKAPPPADILDHPTYREPWKGASGRVAIVEPVKNTPAARLEPLHIPERKIAGTQAISNDRARAQSPESEPLQMCDSERKEPTIRAVASQDSIKPTVPLKFGRGSYSSSRVVSPVTPIMAVSDQLNSLESPFKSPQHTFLHTAPEFVVKPADQELVESPTDNEPLTPTTPTQASTHPTLMESLQPPEPEDADVSRFSWTTYDATEHGSPTQSTFDSSDVPPMPSVLSPVLPRKRPVPSLTDVTPYMNSNAAFSNGSVVLRKPVPAADRNRSSSMITNSSLGKSLPQCPPELEASDKISTLEARLDDLARRKRNIIKIKGALAEALRRNAVAYDSNKRKDVETKLKCLDDEMSEIMREEHEVGLRLHRAQKKRDREENNLEPTTLWIKRVTS